MKKSILFLIVAIMVLIPISAQALMVGDWGGWPTLGLKFNDMFSGYLGFSNFGGTSRSWILAKVDYNLSKLGDVQTR